MDRENIELMGFGVLGFIGMEFLNELSLIAGIIFGLGILIFAMLNYLSGQKRRKEEERAQDKRNQEKHEWERKEHELRMKNMRGGSRATNRNPIIEIKEVFYSDRYG
ncbi:MAG: hypothetical protein OXC64_03405 [Flavobacteriaceae bacterium]|nr:hypothetical protein [Flavobacteriaceae bacterium]